MNNDVIERMLLAWGKCPAGCDGIEAMTAAARVLLDEVCGPVTDEEWNDPAHWQKGRTFRSILDRVLAARRARIEHQRTAEERVTLRSKETIGYSVMLDGKQVWSFVELIHAERYALGLIAQLKEQQ